MIKLLPFILIPVLIIGGLMFWNLRNKANEESSSTTQTEGLVEVPKNLPGQSSEDRVKSLEATLNQLASKVNSLKPSSPTPASSSDPKLSALEASVTELKMRVTALENASPAPAVSSQKTTVYIPLGSGGSWGDQAWTELAEYEISLDPVNYPGYKNMNLEVILRLSEAAGTGSVRLYNKTDGSATSSQLDSTSSSFSLLTSSSFTLPNGVKTYRLQVKSSQGKSLFIQSARIRVNF